MEVVVVEIVVSMVSVGELELHDVMQRWGPSTAKV